MRSDDKFQKIQADFDKTDQSRFHVWTNRTTLMSRPHRHTEVELNFVEKGNVTYQIGGRQSVVPKGRLAVFWAAMPHQVIRIKAPAITHLAAVPLAWLLQWKLEDLTRTLLHGGVIIEPQPAKGREDLALFRRLLADFASGQIERRKLALLEIELRLRRLAMSPAETSVAVHPSSSGLSKAEQMANFVAENYQQPLKVESIAKAVDLNAHYATDLYQKLFGTGINESITQHRVTHAQRLLATSDLKITEVAFESGFRSVRRFYAAFQDICGQSPRQFRQSLKPVRRPSQQAG